ncbi:Enhancer of mrna-decapping protein, partial [Globisporangium splendens]
MSHETNGHSRNSSTSSSGVASSSAFPAPPQPPQMIPPPPPPPHVGLVPPVVLSAPPIPSSLLSHAGRFSPSDHISPEITHSPNPLQQLLQQVPPQPQQLMQHQHQFLQQFMSNNSNGHQRAAPLPPAPLSTPPAPPAALFQQFPPPRSSPPLPLQQNNLSSSFPVVRSVSAAVDGSRSNDAGSSTNSQSGSPRRGSRPGSRISGEHVEYRTLGDQQGESRSLEVMPITLYNSERASQLGNLISVNEHFISYPIRNGLIRVISQSSVDRLLIRKHENHAVTELAFFNSKSDLLLSAGTDNHIAIWSIVSDPMSRELLKTIPTAAQRVKWHPFNMNKIAIVNGGTLFITDLTNVTAEGDGADNLYEISVVCSQSSSQINDIAFSPNAETVLTAGADGLVHVYRISERQNNQAGEFIHRFEPFDGHAVDSLHFYGGNLVTQAGLLIGGEGNSRISLWNAPVSENVQPTCFQTVKVLGSSASTETEAAATPAVVNETLFDPTTQFLFVADRARPIIYVLHLAPSVNARTPRRFDNITEFSLAYPVLSMGVLNRTQSQTARGSDGSDLEPSAADALLNFSMQLYCLQTQAIQRYHVAATNCFVPLKQPVRGSIEDELPSSNESSSSVGAAGGFAQSVGAVTTEGESMTTSYHQSTAESPRAATSSAAAAAASPETEIDVQNGDAESSNNDDENDDDANYRGNARGPASPAHSGTSNGGFPRVNVSVNNDETSSSVGGDDGAFNLRSYARSSPSSSVRAFQDESSVQYEPSLDDTASVSEQTILSFLRRMEVNQSQRDEQLRDQMRTVLGNLGNHMTAQVAIQVEKSIQKQLQTVLVPAMGRIVLHTMENNFMKPVQNGFQHVITEKLIPHMELKLSESLSSALPDQMSAGVHEMVERVVEDVRQPVRESFRECFQDIIIPSFQAATQKMFEQINDTFVKGTRTAFENSGQSNSNAQVTKQLKQLIEVVDGLTQKVDQLAATIGDGDNVGIGNSAAASPEEVQFEAQKKAVREYLSRDDYEEAFKLALGAQNVDLVAYACQQCDVRAVLNVRPLKLSQMLILCLVQQLGADLADDLQTKLNWLRESLLVMDVRDASIAGFVSSVLQELQVGLNNVPEEYRDSQFMLIHHILKSLLSSTV